MIEDRLTSEGRALRERAAAVAGSDTAWESLTTDRPSRGRWLATAAAAVLVALVVVSTVFLRSDTPQGVATPASSTTEPAAAAPQTDPEPSQAETAAPPETTTPTTEPASGSFPSERHCTYTDPGRRPITVSRALDCPDGTEVWVTGEVVETEEGTFLCSEDECNDALQLVGHVRPGSFEFHGVKQGSELHLSP